MPAIVQEVVSLVGELTAFRAVGSDGWGVGTIVVDGKRHDFTGKTLGARPGNTVELQGVWSDHPKYGRRLKVRQCATTTPQSAEGVVAWLITTLPGVGEKRARELVVRFGAELWRVIETTPDRLCEVAGISPKISARIADAYREHRADRDHMVTLRGWGMTDSQIARCIEEWKTLEKVIAAVREDPYQLSRVVYGFGFKRTDELAMRAGVSYDSPQRIAAAIEYLIEESVSGQGHTWLPFGEVRARTARLIGVPAETVNPVLRRLLTDGALVRHGRRIYSRRLDETEQDCAAGIEALLEEAS